MDKITLLSSTPHFLSHPLPATPAISYLYSALVGDSFCILPFGCFIPPIALTQLLVGLSYLCSLTVLIDAYWRRHIFLKEGYVLFLSAARWDVLHHCAFYTLKIEVKALLDITRYMYTLPFRCRTDWDFSLEWLGSEIVISFGYFSRLMKFCLTQNLLCPLNICKLEIREKFRECFVS